MYDFDSSFAETFKETCEYCSREIEVSTQKDHSPEFYTKIHVKCECGNSVEFNLPVN